MEDTRARLEVAHAAAVASVRDIPAEGWPAPTPCAGWDVTDLVRHLVAGERIFAALVTGGVADRARILAAVRALDPDELPAAYDEATGALQAAYAAPGARERPILLPIGEIPGDQGVALRAVETLTHGWDLSRALGRPFEVDPAQVEWAIAASRQVLAGLPPDGPQPFGTPQPVADDAPALDRLAALLGRRVS